MRSNLFSIHFPGQNPEKAAERLPKNAIRLVITKSDYPTFIFYYIYHMEKPKPQKPKWLRKLERERWQAELIISGAALLGSLQLPGILEQFQHYLLLNYERASLQLWFFATSYWALFVYGLVLLFVLHFVVRALWIGLEGLNSVYPNGIGETNLSSEDYQQKMKAEYGDIDGFINRLDRMGVVHRAESDGGDGTSLLHQYCNEPTGAPRKGIGITVPLPAGKVHELPNLPRQHPLHDHQPDADQYQRQL